MRRSISPYRRIALPLSLVLFAAVGAADCRATDWTVDLRGVGPIRIGMTLEQVRRVLGDRQAVLVGPYPNMPLEECAYLETSKTPKELGIMFMRGKVVRVDVWDPGIQTKSGVSVGDTEDRVKQRYPGQIEVAPHHYDGPESHYLNYTPGSTSDRHLGLVFETDGSTVTSFRAGTKEAISLVEGCS